MKVRTSRERDSLNLVSEWAARIDDLQSQLLEHEPTVLHFSGHGSKEPEGLVFAGEQSEYVLMDAKALGSIFRVLKDNIRLVVLNACYSEVQAKAIVEHIDCVVGMRKAIGDAAAIKFAGAMYEALAYGRSVQDAFDLGLAALQAHQIPEDNTPSLLLGLGVDASKVSLFVTGTSKGHDFDYTIVITGRIDAKDKPEVQRIFRELCKLSQDSSLELVAVESGSVVLRFRGSRDGFSLLQKLHQSGALSQQLGVQVEDVRATYAELNSLVDPRYKVTRVEAFPRARFDFPGWPLAEVRDRLDAVQKGVLPPATFNTFGNLTAANIAPNQFFTGRENELARLHAALAGGGAAIVHALTGEGGIGKTELAKVYALIAAEKYDGVWWIDGSAAALRGELMKVYERATGEKPPDNAATESLGQYLVDRWRGTRPLIVLDNVDDAAHFTLFSALATAHILATTRQHYKTMPGVAPFPLGALPIADAVSLMRKEIAATRTDVNDADLTAIATELDGHALAVTLAGAYLANYAAFTAPEVLAKLQASKVGDVDPVANGDEHDLPGIAYRKSVAASLSLSFSHPKVGPALPLLAAAAFLHPTGITLDWFMAGTGWDKARVSKAASVLENFSILKSAAPTATSPAKYTVHRLTQGVARARTDVAGGKKGEDSLTRLLVALIAVYRYPAEYAEQLLDHMKTPARLAAMAHAEAIIGHAEMHARKAGERADAQLLRTPSPTSQEAAIDLGAKVALLRGEMAKWFPDVGMHTAAERHLSAAIAWEEAQSPRDERGLAIHYASRARIRQNCGLLREAEEDIAKSITWGEAQSPRDEQSLAVYYASRSNIRQDRGLLKEAEKDIAWSIAWGEAQSPRDERGLAVYYASRASIRQKRGLLSEAEEDIARSITWGEAQSPQDEHSLAIWYASRAKIRHDQRQFAQALEDLERSLAWGKSRQPIDDWRIAKWYADRAMILAEIDRLPEAVADIAACIAWHRQHQPDNHQQMARCVREQARIFAIAGDWTKATASIDESVPLHEAVYGKDHEWTKKARAWREAIIKKQVPPAWLETTP